MPALSADQQRKERELRERIRHLQRTLAAERSRSQPERRQLAIASFSGELLAAEREYQAFFDDRSHTATMAQATGPLPESKDVRDRLGTDEALGVDHVHDLDTVRLAPYDLLLAKSPVGLTPSGVQVQFPQAEF